MGFYLVGGKLGSGKSLVCVGIIRDALRAGKKVATNLDLYLDKMLPRESRLAVLRMPDKPTIDDLQAIGRGQPGIDEPQNGLLVLDECASWLNARTWGDKDRQPVLDWMLHSRKLGWDVYLITQHMDQLDKQLRVSLIEFSVRCMRLDRIPIPFLSSIVKVLTMGLWKPKAPKVHMGVVRYGTERESIVTDRWMYRGHDLYPAYDTTQVFKADDSAGLHSMLSSWHLRGRYDPRVTLLAWLREWVSPALRTRPKLRPAARLQPLMSLSPEVRWLAARHLVSVGLL